MKWGIRDFNGTEFDLCHLDPFIFVVPGRNDSPEYQVRVTFGCHTFTRAWADDEPAHLRFENGPEVRCFCNERFELSRRLPAIIVNAASGRVHFSQFGNYLIVRDIDGLVGPYVMFFSLARARFEGFDLTMFVDSAYLKPNLPNKLDAVFFSTLVEKTVKGLKLPRKRK